ncbi:MAG: hypothetical protein KJN93_09355 [Alphaproteobacteria bacterium]|nr:hypothetical protein [Alphaproteobacteria bacterium]
MNPPKEPLFLARETYRRRRLQDVARFLPFLATFLFVVPTLWAFGSRTSSGKIYIFVVWLALIAGAFVLSLWLKPQVEDGKSATAPDSEEP